MKFNKREKEEESGHRQRGAGKEKATSRDDRAVT